MCKEAPLEGDGDYKNYNTSNIIEYLKQKYGFEELKITGGFFVDGDVK